LDSVQGTITEVYRAREKRGGGTIQDAKLKDAAGNEVKLAVWDHPDLGVLKGMEVIIQASPKGGLKVVFDNYRPPGVNTISVSKNCTFQKLAVHHAQNGTNAPEAAGTPAKGTPAPIVVNGAKVGMAINCATTFLTTVGEPFDAKRVHAMASEIIRISNALEQGDLIPA